MKRNTILILLICLLAAIARAAYADSFQLSVPPLVPEQPLISSMEEWDGRLIVVTENWLNGVHAPKRNFHYVDLKEKLIKPLIIAAGYEIMALTEDKREALALCQQDGIFFIFKKFRNNDNNQWEKQQVNIQFEKDEEIRFAVNSNSYYLINGPYIWQSRNARQWEKIPLNKIIGERKEVNKWPNWDSPRAILCTNDALFLGYNGGEWGGSAYVIPLNNYGLSGKGFRIGSFNVTSIKIDHNHNVWIAGGLSHLSGRYAFLFQYRNKKVTPIIDQKGFEGRNLVIKNKEAKIELPLTEINGLAINNAGNPVIVASRIGVLEYSNGKISPVIAADLYITYTLPKHWVGSSPMGIVIQDDDIYIASSSLGVLEFKKKVQGYELRQINFAKSAEALQ